MTPERVEREVALDASPTEVWVALTDPAQLSEWFGADVEIEPHRGGRVRFRFSDGSERGAVIETFDSERLLALRWLPFERAVGGSTEPRPSTTVRFSLRPRGSGTVLVVHESVPALAPREPWGLGVPPGGGVAWPQLRAPAGT